MSTLPSQHAPWCDARARVETHAICIRAIGVVLVNGDLSVSVELRRYQQTPAVMMIDVRSGRRSIVLPLNRNGSSRW